MIVQISFFGNEIGHQLIFAHANQTNAEIDEFIGIEVVFGIDSDGDPNDRTNEQKTPKIRLSAIEEHLKAEASTR